MGIYLTFCNNYQLKGDAKIFYDAMYEMYVQGIFKTGKQEYDLVE